MGQEERWTDGIESICLRKGYCEGKMNFNLMS